MNKTLEIGSDITVSMKKDLSRVIIEGAREIMPDSTKRESANKPACSLCKEKYKNIKTDLKTEKKVNIYLLTEIAQLKNEHSVEKQELEDTIWELKQSLDIAQNELKLLKKQEQKESESEGCHSRHCSGCITNKNLGNGDGDTVLQCSGSAPKNTLGNIYKHSLYQFDEHSKKWLKVR